MFTLYYHIKSSLEPQSIKHSCSAVDEGAWPDLRWARLSTCELNQPMLCLRWDALLLSRPLIWLSVTPGQGWCSPSTAALQTFELGSSSTSATPKAWTSTLILLTEYTTTVARHHHQRASTGEFAHSFIVINPTTKVTLEALRSLLITWNPWICLDFQLPVRPSVREHPQSWSLQQPQQQQPDTLPENAQLSELYFWLPPTSDLHTPQQHTRQRTWRQQDTRASSG